ncbi:unnamed protein product [Mytilus edulis]|uniref:Integrase core domain-containing protein n=1 Tax=Mytilus edulis TaxID=6550 RepID=A0A8S3Q2Q0_MYTED|nr:unnamed protein product [Mytilus edulis]
MQTASQQSNDYTKLITAITTSCETLTTIIKANPRAKDQSEVTSLQKTISTLRDRLLHLENQLKIQDGNIQIERSNNEVNIKSLQSLLDETRKQLKQSCETYQYEFNQYTEKIKAKDEEIQQLTQNIRKLKTNLDTAQDEAATNQQQHRNDTQSKPKVLFLGTSNIKAINEAKLTTAATVEKVVKYTLKETVAYVTSHEDRPDLVVLHSLTNDLKHLTPQQCIDELDQFISLIHDKWSLAKIIISLTTPRKIEYIKTESKFVLWCKISKVINRLDDILLGIIYIPPEYTSYSSIDAINEIEMELFELSHKFSKCLLVGDFNARTGSEDDFIFVPDSESHVVDIENIQINAVCNLDQYDFSRKRNSRDKNKNRFGNQLLEFCKGNNFFIMNGRTLGDIDGKFTCRNSSVVDYCLCSAELIQNFTDFKVLDFSSLYSDVHSPIEISLKQTDQEVSTKCSDDTRTNEQKINNWTNEKSYKFLECLNLTEIENINSEIDGTTVVTQETVDMIISKIGKVLINSAGNTFGFKVSAGKKSEHRKNKPWFDHDCKAARSEFRKMKRNKNKSPFHRALVSDAEKRYKNTMNKAHKKYRSDFRKKMDDLKQKDAKEFWRLLNENKSTAQPKIDFDKLVSYFKELNSDLRDDTEEQQIERRVMEEILINHGLKHLLQRFKLEKISPEILCQLSSHEMEELGVQNRSDMMNLRLDCSKYMALQSQLRYFQMEVCKNLTFNFKLILENLLEIGLKISDISKILSVSERTVYRRMAIYDLSKTSFSEMKDNDLDRNLIEIIRDFPQCGETFLRIMLKRKGIHVPRWRLRDSIKRVDENGLHERRRGRLHRRIYNVEGPNYLWHIDTNHKLIRWKFVIVGGN